MDNNPNGNRPDHNKGPGRQDPNKNHQSILAFLVCLLVTLVCFAMFTNMLKDNSSEITYDKFIEMVDDGDVKENYSINQPRDCEIYVISGFLFMKTESVLFLQQQNLFVFF